MITAVRVPDSVAAAATYAAAGGRVMGGGTIVMAQVNSGSLAETELISLRKAGVSGIRVDGRVVRIGAATTFADIERSPELAFLHAAMRTIASPPIRNLATVGGNLFVPQPYGDFAVCLLALGATVEIAGPGGPRRAPVEDVLTAGVAQGEFVTAVALSLPAAGTWFHHKAMRRKLNSAAIVAVAAVVDTADGVVTSARIALGGVAPRPVRAVSAERLLTGRPLEHDVLNEAGRAARADIAPFDDAYASAWYRRRVLPVHLRRALLG
ncbi:FAD binding domain-containing protein [Actinomadura alba]|uniref:FAD binding domain-containing protein n=1 Tax=Actinomadura alba TaxID=406431 RepID=A0ABR7M1L2_9ACTN|nr:FAD binding domain-containing protein [Actinomadura alba]MBC6470577.1 FAD binding domain-containing protein [Actinomadura alba]